MANCNICGNENAGITITNGVCICDNCVAPFVQHYRKMYGAYTLTEKDNAYHKAIETIQDTPTYSVEQKQMLMDALTIKRGVVTQNKLPEEHPTAYDKSTGVLDVSGLFAKGSPSSPATGNPVTREATPGSTGGFASFMGRACIILGIIGALILASVLGRDYYGRFSFPSFIGIFIAASFSSFLLGSIALGISDIQKRLARLEQKLDREE